MGNSITVKFSRGLSIIDQQETSILLVESQGSLYSIFVEDSNPYLYAFSIIKPIEASEFFKSKLSIIPISEVRPRFIKKSGLVMGITHIVIGYFPAHRLEGTLRTTITITRNSIRLDISLM